MLPLFCKTHVGQLSPQVFSCVKEWGEPHLAASRHSMGHLSTCSQVVVPHMNVRSSGKPLKWAAGLLGYLDKIPLFIPLLNSEHTHIAALPPLFLQGCLGCASGVKSSSSRSWPRSPRTALLLLAASTEPNPVVCHHRKGRKGSPAPSARAAVQAVEAAITGPDHSWQWWLRGACLVGPFYFFRIWSRFNTHVNVNSAKWASVRNAGFSDQHRWSS